ncbi:hypothetical protein TAMA11512_05650 [Selenomonas sp. TAMA-11512]|uniref:cytochrome c biogenesis protein CcsA n=1 Tax=Selenomonas sp. TAMA-11512 TaxID=3095337 RepID=UPI003092A27C|nr:hypothetical protein TAMA11512_05650 [Selenomonas sp. TAMA-11512]
MRLFTKTRALVILTLHTVGFILFAVPPAEGLGELVRLAFVHIPAAWVSVLAFLLSAWWAFRYLRGKDMRYDRLSGRSAKLGFYFVIFATITGAVFGRLTWGSWWNWDPRQTTIFILILIYGAYLTLRAAVPEERKRASVSAVYSLLSCLSVPFLVFILPRLYFSLHPQPVLNSGGHIDMDPVMLTILILAVVNATCIYLYLLYRSEGGTRDEA